MSRPQLSSPPLQSKVDVLGSSRFRRDFEHPQSLDDPKAGWLEPAMRKTIDAPILSDTNQFPSGSVVFSHIGKTKALWRPSSILFTPITRNLPGNGDITATGKAG
jgi:hypothetical protein